MPWVWVSVGSNVDRERSLRGAVEVLRERYGPLRISRVYESDAVGFDGPPFYNLVLGFATSDSAAKLDAAFKSIERDYGRQRGGDKFAPRALDIDLLTYGDEVRIGGAIELPRDEILRYAFVLGPLAELAGDELHPVERRSYRELWQVFDRTEQPLRPVALDLSL